MQLTFPRTMQKKKTADKNDENESNAEKQQLKQLRGLTTL